MEVILYFFITSSSNILVLSLSAHWASGLECSESFPRRAPSSNFLLQPSSLGYRRWPSRKGKGRVDIEERNRIARLKADQEIWNYSSAWKEDRPDSKQFIVFFEYVKIRKIQKY